MEFTGKFDEKLREKAIKEAGEMLQRMFIGIPRDVYKYTQLSWRLTGKKTLFLFPKRKKASSLNILQFNFFDVKKIHFHSPVMIDVFAQLGANGVYRIRMIAEKKPYITSPDARFRYNPNSIRKTD